MSMSAEKAAEVVREIREKYPNERIQEESICVGLAAKRCGYLNRVGFWGPRSLRPVADLNDAGRFDEAWAALERALVEYG